jgi:abortive infection bacteriophage resistance protein
VKPFLTYTQQLDKLKEKGLIIENREYAEEKLRQISYFGLINGYKQPFKDANGGYIKGPRFDDIVELYNFDEGLRSLFLRWVLRVERHIRSLVSYAFTERYGESQEMYLNPSNFASGSKNENDSIDKLIKSLADMANNDERQPYLVSQRKAHGNVPLWALICGVSFGTLSKFYRYMQQPQQASVAKNFPNVNSTQLGQILSVMTYL